MEAVYSKEGPGTDQVAPMNVEKASAANVNVQQPGGFNITLTTAWRRLTANTAIFIGLFNSLLSVYSTATALSTEVIDFDRDATIDEEYNSRYPTDTTPFDGNKRCVGVFANLVDVQGNAINTDIGWQPTMYADQSLSGPVDPAVCCTAGILQTTATCTTGKRPDVKILIAVWCIIWSVLLFYMIIGNFDYLTTDLRFYINIEGHKKTIMNRMIGCFALLLTVGQAAYALDFINGADSTALRMSIVVGAIVNITMIMPCMSSAYTHITKETAGQLEETTINFIQQKTLSNFSGLIVTPVDLFKSIEMAMHHGFVSKDNSDLEAIGDSNKLTKAMVLVMGESMGELNELQEEAVSKSAEESLVASQYYTKDESLPLLRRFAAVLPLAFGLVNTLSMFTSQAQVAASRSAALDFSPTATKLASNVANGKDLGRSSVAIVPNLVNSLPYTWIYDYKKTYATYSCNEGVSGIAVQCNYGISVNYVSTVSVGVTLWGLLIISQLLLSGKYPVDDLRYYLSVERNKSLTITKVLSYCLSILTIVMVIYVLIIAGKRGQQGLASEMETVLGMLAIQAGIVNFQRLMPMSSTYFPDLNYIDIEKQFPTKIPMKIVVKPSIMNLYGVLQDENVVFGAIMQALTVLLKTGNDSELKACIDSKDDAEAAKLVVEVKKVMTEMTGHHH